MKNSKRVAEKESDEEFQHLEGCFRYFFIALTSLLFWSGLSPIKIDKKTGGIANFKLVSLSSVFTFIRLVIFNFPVLILPLILFYGGPAKREYEEITGKNFTHQHPIPSLGVVHYVESYSAFLVFILPLVLSSVQAKPINKMYYIIVKFLSSFVMEEKPKVVNVKHVLLPLIGFLLYAFGKLLNHIHVLMKFDFPLLSINVFMNTCYLFLGHLPLHFLLAMHEHFMYQEFEIFHAMCSWTLRANNGSKALLERASCLPDLMEAIQGCFGLFVFVDITLMLVYWLLHTYNAYFAFQVTRFQNNSISSAKALLCDFLVMA